MSKVEYVEETTKIWKTTDGHKFVSKEIAELHQTKIDRIKTVEQMTEPYAINYDWQHLCMSDIIGRILAVLFNMKIEDLENTANDFITCNLNSKTDANKILNSLIDIDFIDTSTANITLNKIKDNYPAKIIINPHHTSKKIIVAEDDIIKPLSFILTHLKTHNIKDVPVE